MIMSATRPLMPNLVFVHLAVARPHKGEVVTPLSIFYLLYFLTFLLTCVDRIVRR